MANNYYRQTVIGAGVFYGRTLIQASGEIGGHKHVFVKWQGGSKDALIFPPVGCVLGNPFKGAAKAFAGDLFEYHTTVEADAQGIGYLLKTYLVADDADSTTVNIIRDGYKHKPFVGDILMKAPDELDGTGDSATVTAVTRTTLDDGTKVWQLTLDGSIGSLAADDILVEAKEAGSGVNALVTNPNAYLQCDYDFLFNPREDDEDFESGALYTITPCLANHDTVLWKHLMSPTPKSILNLNLSRVEGWFNL